MTPADLYRALWRRKWLILGLTVLCVAITYWLSERVTPKYEASTLVRVQQRIEEAGQAFESLEASQRLTETYAEIVEAGALGERVRRELGPAARGPIEKDALSAKPVQDLELLTISAKDPDANRATAVANAVPGALRTFIKETGTLRDQVVTVASAARPTSPATPNIPLNLALALFLGLLANIGLALLLEFFSDRLPEVDELEESIGLPVLAAIPWVTPTRAAPHQPAGAQQVDGQGAVGVERERSGIG